MEPLLFGVRIGIPVFESAEHDRHTQRGSLATVGVDYIRVANLQMPVCAPVVGDFEFSGAVRNEVSDRDIFNGFSAENTMKSIPL